MSTKSFKNDDPVTSENVGCMYIYKITNKVNGKVYIGQTINEPKKRWRYHITPPTTTTFKSYIQKAIHKYGESNFLFETIDSTNDLTILNQKEILYITLFNSMAPFGYNLHTGGNSHTVTDITRKRLSVSHLGQPAWNKGMKCSDELKAKFRAAKLGKSRNKQSVERSARSKWKSVQAVSVNKDYSLTFDSIKQALETGFNRVDIWKSIKTKSIYNNLIWSFCHGV